MTTSEACLTSRLTTHSPLSTLRALLLPLIIIIGTAASGVVHAAPPTVSVSVNGSPVSAGATLSLHTDETILFDASASAGVYTHSWDFGDGTAGLKASTPKVAYGYRATGGRAVTYTACNNAGECSSLTFTVAAAARTFGTPQTFSTLVGLQEAINNDTGGGDFVLTANSYTGTLNLINHAGNPTRIRCSSGYGAPEVRTTAATGLCAITAPNNQPALTTSTSAANYLIEGFAFKFAAGANSNGVKVPVVQIGSSNESETTTAQLPTNITLRHCHISIPDDAHAVEGIKPHGRHLAVLDSTVKNIHYSASGQSDAQAIWGWHGTYGLWVDNCFLSADTEVAGAGGGSSGLTQRPEAITYRRTHFYKPDSWTLSESWWNKNVFELKTGRSVNVDSCIMETTDADNNQGYPITLTAYRDTDGRNDAILDVSFTRLKIKNTPGFLSVCNDCGQLGGPSGGEVQRVRFEDIVLDNQENSTRQGAGIFIKLETQGASAGPIDRLSFNRITAPLNYVDRNGADVWAFLKVFIDANAKMTNFSFTNVVGNSVGYQIFSSGGFGSVGLTNSTSSGYTWAGNVIAGITNSPPDGDNNEYPTNRNEIGFVNLNGGVGGDYRLSASSEYKNRGTNNSRPGADIDAVEEATQGVISGEWKQGVAWTSLSGSTLSGTTIGHDGGPADGHAESTRSLPHGDGSFAFTVMQTGNYWGAGLNSGAKAVNYAGLEYGLVLRGTTNAEVLESGTYRWEFPVQVNDVLKIAVESGKVNYYRIRGGSALLVYTNETPTLAYPLRANAIFLSTNSSIKDGLLSGAWADNVNWTSLSGSSINGTTIGHNGGESDGHAESSQSLPSGDGSFEFTVMQTGNYWGAGLNSGAKATSYAGLEYAFALRGTTNAEVLESGIYRTEIAVQANDILKVEIASGQVKYYRIRGGTTTHVYTNPSPALSYPLRANAIFLSTNSSIKDGFAAGFGN